MEEEREIDARDDENDEAVQGELTEHERPVVRKDLVERAPSKVRRAEPAVEPPRDTVRKWRPTHGPAAMASANSSPRRAPRACTGCTARPPVPRAPPARTLSTQ